MIRLDLPQDAFFRPQWYANAIYERGPKGLTLKGYTKPALRTFDQNVAVLQRDSRLRATWVWYNGEWVRV